MKSRLQQFLSAEQLSPARLSDLLGIQRSGLSHIMSGRNKPSYDFINRLCLKFPSLNPDWLITGRGKMYRDQISNPVSEKRVDEKGEEHSQLADDLLFDNQYLDSELPENKKITNFTGDGHKKRVPAKILVLYTDGTFEGFNPASENEQ